MSLSTEYLQALGTLINASIDANPGATSAELDDIFRDRHESLMNEKWNENVDGETLWLEHQIKRTLAKRAESGSMPVPAPKTTTFKDIALPIAARNIPVIRLQPKSKIPMDKAWQNQATTDVDKILAWDKETPNANCACVAKPDGVLFFETDESGVIERYEQETGEKLPKTFTVQSREGRYHFYWLQTDESRKCGSITQKEIPFGSLRQNNAYVVSSGSVHPTTGLLYTVLNDSPIVPIPTSLINWLTAQKPKTTPKTTVASNLPVLSPEDLEVRIQQAVSGDPIGLRQHDVKLTSIAGKLRELGLEYDRIETLLIKTCESRCVNYGSDYIEMCKKIAKSVCRYPAGNPGPTVMIAGKLPGASVRQTATSEVASSTEPQSLVEAAEDFLRETTEDSRKEFADLNALCDESYADTHDPYPNDAWVGTPYIDIAKACRNEGTEYENFLPTEFCINAALTTVGSIIGDRVHPEFDSKMEGRFYTILLTMGGGSGKGSVTRFITEDLFAGTGLVSLSSGISADPNLGVYMDDFASARGLIDAFMDNPRILQVFASMLSWIILASFRYLMRRPR